MLCGVVTKKIRHDANKQTTETNTHKRPIRLQFSSLETTGNTAPTEPPSNKVESSPSSKRQQSARLSANLDTGAETPPKKKSVSGKMGSNSKVTANVIFVMGGPGAGKGTVCQKLKEEFGFAHYSAGDLLRAEVKSGSERGKMLETLMKEGKIVPSAITVELLKKNIMAHPHVKCFLIDGFPRNMEQAGMFENEITEAKFLLNLDCSEQIMTERILHRAAESGEKRADDNPETLAKRFRTHREVCMPVIEAYRLNGRLRQVDASLSAEEVYQKVRELALPYTK